MLKFFGHRKKQSPFFRIPDKCEKPKFEECPMKEIDREIEILERDMRREREGGDEQEQKI